MDTLCGDMILSICFYLDDPSYISLWITSKRYCVLLRNEKFLRTLFRDRNIDNLSLCDLRRGFKNIIHRPTVTCFAGKKFINHYLLGNNEFLFDIFERLWIVQLDGLQPTGMIVQARRINKIADKYYYFRDHEKNLIITDTKLDVVTIFDDVDNTITQVKALLFRQAGVYKLYVPDYDIVLLNECFLPAPEIKSMILTIHSADGKNYSIDSVLDNKGRLIVGHKVIARDVVMISSDLDNNFFCLNVEGDLILIKEDRAVILDKDVKDFVHTANSIAYETKSNKVYFNGKDRIKLVSSRGALIDHHRIVECLNLDNDTTGPNVKEIFAQPFEKVTLASFNRNHPWYIVIQHSPLL